jgi:hypothetical protein
MPARLIVHAAFSAFFLTLAGSSVHAQQGADDEILRSTRSWLKSVNQGDRAGMNAIMDARFLAVLPAGDVVTKERLAPDDPERPVPRLPPFDLSDPIVRIYGDTAVLMTRLTTADATQTLNATFVYGKRDNAWKLVALHASPR